MHRIAYAMLFATFTTLTLAGCDDGPAFPDRGEVVTADYSFESGLQGWTVQATDITIGGDTIDWEIARSTDLARDGSTALRLRMDNRTDAGKIWIQRAFDLDPSTTYEVDVAYAFASSDWGDFNHFRIITGAFADAPRTTDDLQPAFQGDTGIGADQDVSFRWLDKSYSFTVTTDADGMLYVVIGVWGTYEVPRTYFLDDVRVEIRPA